MRLGWGAPRVCSSTISRMPEWYLVRVRVRVRLRLRVRFRVRVRVRVRVRPEWYRWVSAPFSRSSTPFSTRWRCESSCDGSILSASASRVAMNLSSAANPSVLSRPRSNWRRYG